MDPQDFKVKLDQLAELKLVDGQVSVSKIKPQHYECPYGGPGNCKIESRLLGQSTKFYKSHWRHRCKTCAHYIVDNDYRLSGGPMEVTAFFKKRAEKLHK